MRKEVRSILVTMGGSDINDFTTKVIEALGALDLPNVRKTVIVGPAFEDGEKFKSYRDFNFKYNVSNMAEILFDADIVIAGAGMTLYELACVGTPGIVLCQTDYQLFEARVFAQEGVVLNLGARPDITEEAIKTKVKILLNDIEKRKEMSALGKKLIDGKSIDRIVSQVLEKRSIS